MPAEDTISVELRRAGIAASTIREALGPWREREMLSIIAELAKSPASLESLVGVQARAKSYYSLTKELERAMNQGKEND